MRRLRIFAVRHHEVPIQGPSIAAVAAVTTVVAAVAVAAAIAIAAVAVAAAAAAVAVVAPFTADCALQLPLFERVQGNGVGQYLDQSGASVGAHDSIAPQKQRQGALLDVNAINEERKKRRKEARKEGRGMSLSGRQREQ